MVSVVAPPTGTFATPESVRVERRRHGASAGEQAGQTGDILVVEDEPSVRELLRQVLRDEGYSVADAAGGEQAVTLLRQGHYRLLLLDLMMPGVDGFHVLRALRAEPALRPPAVLILSALRERADVLAALEAGVDDYLTKPFDITDLALRVTMWLRRTSPATPLGAPGLRVHSLGRSYVEHGGQIRLHPDTRPRKAHTLFAYLLSRQGRPVPRAEALALLWPDAPEELRDTSLRTLHYQLRRLLGLPSQGPSCLQVGPARLALTLGPGDWWDVAEFRAWLAEGARWQRAGDAARALDAYAAGVALYGGDYLAEDPSAAWAGALRGRLRAEWLDALGAMARLHEARGEWAEQEALLRRALQADPYREPDLRALMELLTTQGRRAEALALYHALAGQLQASLRAELAPETRALAARIGATSPGS